MSKKSSGSIVIFSLLILSLMVVLTQQLLKSVYVSSSFITTMIDRERAEMIALGGVNVALKTLSLQIQEKKDVQKGQKKQANKDEVSSDPMKKFLGKVLPHLNRWKIIKLDEDLDGVAGELKICISCEDGKININNIFDFKKGEFKTEYAPMLKSLEIRGKLGQGELYSRLSDFFKKKKKPITDVSELYEIEGINTLDIFYSPPLLPDNKKEKPKSNTYVALQDIFTVWSDGIYLEPLMLSDALCAICGLRRPIANDAEKLKDGFNKLVESYQENWGSNWNENWRHLQDVYGEKPRVVQNLNTIFSKQFGAHVYSVLSSGKVGNVEQRLLAIVKKINVSSIKQQREESKNKDQNNKNDNTKENVTDQSNKYVFKIVRAYWI